MMLQQEFAVDIQEFMMLKDLFVTWLILFDLAVNGFLGMFERFGFMVHDVGLMMILL